MAMVSSSPNLASTGSRLGPMPTKPTILPACSATHHRCGADFARSPRQRSSSSDVTLRSDCSRSLPNPAFHESMYMRVTASASAVEADRMIGEGFGESACFNFLNAVSHDLWPNCGPSEGTAAGQGHGWAAQRLTACGGIGALLSRVH